MSHYGDVVKNTLHFSCSLAFLREKNIWIRNLKKKQTTPNNWTESITVKRNHEWIKKKKILVQSE